MIEADNAPNALALGRRYHPNIMLIDLKLQGVDGYVLTRMIRAEPQLRDTPILLLTSYDSATVRATAQAAGSTGLLHKPFHAAEL